MALLRSLPLTACFYLGWLLGATLWLLLPGYRSLAARNLAIAFGKEMSPQAVRKLTFRHFATLGANALSAVRLGVMTEPEIRACTRTENFEIMQEALDSKRGVVMVISHIGNWELFSKLRFYGRNPECGTIYQALRNKRMDDLLNAERRKDGVQTFDRKKGFTAAIAMLKRGGLVGVLADQHAGDSGIWMPFFQRLASTSPLAASMALKTGADLVPVAIYTEGVARWRLVVSPPIPTRGEDVAGLTLKINQVLEQQIRISPADWFWVHNRWKTPDPEFLLGQSKRGYHLPEGTGNLQPFSIVIRSSNWLGDAVMSIPAVRAIKAGRPDARVAILTPAKLAQLWNTVAEVDEVVTIQPGESIFQVAAKLRNRFDVGILFPNSLRSALELWLAGTPRRVGYAGHHRRWLINQFVYPPKKTAPPAHHALRYLRIAEKTGALPVEGKFQPLPSLKKTSWKLALCPGAEYGPAKQWLPERFRSVIEQLGSRGHQFVIVGTGKDREVAERIAQDLPQVENWAGKTSMAELITLLKTCDGLISNDTGTAHLAAYLGIPVVAIFGSTEPKLTSPWGEKQIILRHQVECSPCFLRECPIDFRCMNAVSVEEVVQAVETLLNHLE